MDGDSFRRNHGSISGSSVFSKRSRENNNYFLACNGGTNGEVLQQIVDDFNASQDEIEIKAEYQGTYDDTITKLKAAMQSDSVFRMFARCMT